MTRARPATTDLPTYGPTFDAMCAAASIHWRTTLPAPPDDAPVVVVDVLMQDLRLALRALTLANSLRRLQPSRLVALVGPDRLPPRSSASPCRPAPPDSPPSSCAVTWTVATVGYRRRLSGCGSTS